MRIEQYCGLVKAIQRSKTEKSLERNTHIFHLRAPKLSQSFYFYFKNSWLCKKWIKSFCDIYRVHSEGLWNTNNFTEAQIKRLGILFFKRKTTASIVHLLTQITQAIIPETVTRRTQIKLGLVRQKRSRTLHAFKKRLEEGKKFSKNVEKIPRSQPPQYYFHISEKKKYLITKMGFLSYECSCRFWWWHGKICKHVCAVLYSLKMEKSISSLLFALSGRTKKKSGRPGSFKKARKGPQFKKLQKRGKKKSVHNQMELIPIQSAPFGRNSSAPVENSTPRTVLLRKSRKPLYVSEEHAEWSYVISEVKRVGKEIKNGNTQAFSFPEYWRQLASHVPKLEIPEEFYDFVVPECMCEWFINNLPFQYTIKENGDYVQLEIVEEENIHNNNNNNLSKTTSVSANSSHPKKRKTVESSTKKRKTVETSAKPKKIVETSQPKKRKIMETSNPQRQSSRRSRTCCVCGVVEKSDGKTIGQKCTLVENGPAKKQCSCAAAGVRCTNSCQCDC